MAELILSSDTLDIGRQKINNFADSVVGVWSSDTTNYSIFSRIGATNYNYSNGNYGLVAGSNNSGITGDYASFLGGKNNYSKANFNLIGNGLNNKIINSLSSYSTIFNGSTNQIGSQSTSKYSSILNGKLNNLYQGNNNLISGVENKGDGVYSFVFGKKNFFKRAGTNPQRNFVFGESNTVSGSSTMNDNFVLGNFNTLVQTFPGSTTPGGLTKYCAIIGTGHKIWRNGSVIFAHGMGHTNTGDDTFSKNDLVLFGRGINPKNSYSMCMGSASTRKIRMEFGAGASSINLTGPGSVNLAGADYGEYFEWKDKNINNESRIGLFVSLDQDKIVVSNNSNTIGIVSETTAFIGDSNDDYWSDMYLKDEWGRLIYENIEEYKININGTERLVYFGENDVCFDKLPNPKNSIKQFIHNINKKDGEFIREIKLPLFNPNYDSSKPYISRESRKEWDVVGLLGKLRVRTSEQITSNFVDVDINNGMAKNGTKYHVLKKIKDFDGNYGIVLIFFK